MAILGPYGFKETHTDDWVGKEDARISTSCSLYSLVTLQLAQSFLLSLMNERMNEWMNG